MNYPWHFVKDMNGDGFFTITDVYKLIAQLYYLPGDSLLFYIITQQKGFAQFFEIGPDFYRGLISFMVSLICWLIVCVAVYGLKLSISEWVEKRFPEKPSYENMREHNKREIERAKSASKDM